jgi:LPS export ABC transporter protein LptC
MLFSCENSIKEVNKVTKKDNTPLLSGENVDFTYTDSTKTIYKARAIEFIQVKKEDEEYYEFPKGGFLNSFNEDEVSEWEIKADYAKHFIKEQLWELRNNVVAKGTDGKIINTELLYWDQKKGRIYSDRYVRITTADGQVLEGNSFESDDKLNKIVLSKVKGELLIDSDKTKQPQKDANK